MGQFEHGAFFSSAENDAREALGVNGPLHDLCSCTTASSVPRAPNPVQFHFGMLAALSLFRLCASHFTHTLDIASSACSLIFRSLLLRDFNSAWFSLSSSRMRRSRHVLDHAVCRFHLACVFNVRFSDSAGFIREQRHMRRFFVFSAQASGRLGSALARYVSLVTFALSLRVLCLLARSGCEIVMVTKIVTV